MSDRDPFDDDEETGNFEEPQYKVGYGKPPANRRFGAGPDENPRHRKGRPKGAKNRNTLVRKILKEPRTLTIDGRKRRMTQLEALLYKLRDLAMNGNDRARKLLEEYTSYGQQYEGPTGVLITGETLPVDLWLSVYTPHTERDPRARWYHGLIPPPDDDDPPP